MFALRSLVLALFCASSFAACMKAPTVAFENATAGELVLRTSVDGWFQISECNSGDVQGAINLQGTFDLESGERLCMKAKPRKDSVPAAELVSRVVVLRDAQRCLSLDRDDIQSNLERSGGFLTYVITEQLCSAANAAAAQTAPPAETATP